MSTILKALRRLEEDERVQAPMSLDEALLDSPESVRPPRRIGTTLAGVAAALGVLAIAWSLSGLWLPTPDGSPAKTVESAAPAPKPRVAKQEPPAIPEGIEETPGSPPSEPGIEVFANPEAIRLEMQSLLADLIPPAKEPEPAPQVSPKPDPPVQVVEKAPPEKPALAAVVEESKAPPAPARSPAAVAKAPAPAPVSEPVAGVERVPAVREIIWHPNPARRVAVFEVDGAKSQRLGEGDQVAGFTVREIGLSEVELVRNGVTLKRRIAAN